MKVTKAIREYITEEIDEIFAPKLAAIKEEKEKIREQAKQYVIYYVKKCDEFNKELEADFKEQTGYEYTPKYTSRRFVECKLYEDDVTLSNPRYKELRDQEEHLEEKRNKSLRKTIAMLELGGTKTELDEVLAQIKEELN